MRPFGHKRRESTVEQATLGTKSREVRRHVCELTVNTPVENLQTLQCYIFQSPLTQATLDTQPDTDTGTNAISSSRSVDPYQTQDARRIQSR